MKYILGMGFYGTVYKRIPTIQIFIGDRLIDEYQPESINSYETYKINMTRNWWANEWSEVVQTIHYNTTKDDSNPAQYKLMPKYFKLYTLDEKFLKNQSTIELNIKNADSNYSNSFMTKSTIMNMSNIFLIPTKIFKHYLIKQKQPGEFYSKIKDIIPSSIKEWDNIHDAKYNDSWFKGYPYPFKYFWNNECISNSLTYFFGGNGTLKFDLIYKNNTVMFDYYENQLLKLMKDGWFETKYSLKLKRLKKISDVCYGFPFSTDFFALSHMLNSNK